MGHFIFTRSANPLRAFCVWGPDPNKRQALLMSFTTCGGQANVRENWWRRDASQPTPISYNENK